MDLPIDMRKAPFRQKYLDEETRMLAIWTVFGEFVDDGTVCVSDPYGDIFHHVPKDKAEALVAARDDFCRRVVNIINSK
jgi:hypothetical protein